ncbi:MAG: transposase [Halieaceae bacterium]|nr:transposase [Halieaceae bacterium]
MVRHISALRAAFRHTLADHPLTIEAIVVLPDHSHCLWRLPAGDDDFPTRWRLIKSRFSRRIPAGERISNSRARRAERGLWQRRYREVPGFVPQPSLRAYTAEIPGRMISLPQRTRRNAEVSRWAHSRFPE